MEHRQRKGLAALVLVLSLLIVGYLLFFTPSESTIQDPAPPIRQIDATPDVSPQDARAFVVPT